MLRFLFPRLTNEPPRGQKMFDRAVAEARQPSWFVEGEVPDTLDGRFAMLTTICALVTVRLEAAGAVSPVQSAALTERFIEAMDAEHRQLGLNDPTLGKRVRKMVGLLARKVGEWRSATEDGADWVAVTRSSVYRDPKVSPKALAFTAGKLRELWQRLRDASQADVAEGRF